MTRGWPFLLLCVQLLRFHGDMTYHHRAEQPLCETAAHGRPWLVAVYSGHCKGHCAPAGEPAPSLKAPLVQSQAHLFPGHRRACQRRAPHLLAPLPACCAWSLFSRLPFPWSRFYGFSLCPSFASSFLCHNGPNPTNTP